MAQAYIDSFVCEVIGQATAFKMAQIEHIVMEVLGYFKFGYVEVDSMVMEVIGQATAFKMAQIQHFVAECIGQWDNF